MTNALRRDAAIGWLSPADVGALLEIALRLDIELVGDSELHRRALQLAETLSLPAACDAHYLALAERLGAEFWTADARLVRAVQNTLPWVHGIGNP